MGLLVPSFHDEYVVAKADNDYQRIDNPGATYKTQRVWLSNDNEYFYEGDYKNNVSYSYQDKNYVIEMPSIINTYDNKTYYYADIPYEVSTMSFLRMKDNDIGKKIDKTIYYGGCYFASGSSLEDFDINIGVVENADANILSLVVESYLTYGKSDSIGCTSSTVQTLFNTWFKNKSASKDDLKNAKIKDYTGYAANNNSYEGLTKESEFSVNEKWNTMCSQAGIDPNTGLHRSIDVSWFKSKEFIGALIIGGTAIVVGGSLIGYLLIKKKRMVD